MKVSLLMAGVLAALAQVPAAGADARFRVFAQDPPPASDGDHALDYYFLTDAASNNPLTLTPGATTAHVGKYYRVWGNFCSPPKEGSVRGDGKGCVGGNLGKRNKGNYLNFPVIHTPEGTNRFSSYDQADDCTLAQTAFMLGRDARSIAANWGRRLSFVWTPAGWHVPQAPFHDICIMPVVAVPTVDGILIDYEPGDGRTPQQTTTFLKSFTDLVHAAGKKAVLYGHVLTRSRNDGIDADNAVCLNAMFDYMTIGAWANADYSGNGSMQTSLNSQMNVLEHGGSPIRYANLMITFDLGGATLADAATVRSFMLAHGIDAVIFWKDVKRSNGEPVRAKIACLLKAICGARASSKRE